MLHDPKRDPFPAEEREVPPPQPDILAQCPACLGSGVVRVGPAWDHVGDPRACRGCFGAGVLSLPHQDDPTEDSVWEAAIELLDTFAIEKDAEAYGYEQRNGTWEVKS